MDWSKLTTNEVEIGSLPQSDEEGAGQNDAGLPPVLPDLYLANTALHHICVFRAEIGDPFNTLKTGSIHTDPIDIVYFYVG